MLSPADVSSRSGSWASLAGGLGAVLLPKCPLCFAAYGSALGTIGLSPAAHQWLAEPLIVTAVIGSVAIVFVLALRRRDPITPAVSAAGAVLVVVGRFALDRPTVTAVGALLLVGGALVNTARCRSAGRLPPTAAEQSRGVPS